MAVCTTSCLLAGDPACALACAAETNDCRDDCRDDRDDNVWWYCYRW